MTSSINKDISLDGCQYSGKMRFRVTTHPFEASMDYMMGVEVVKTISNVM